MVCACESTHAHMLCAVAACRAVPPVTQPSSLTCHAAAQALHGERPGNDLAGGAGRAAQPRRCIVISDALQRCWDYRCGRKTVEGEARRPSVVRCQAASRAARRRAVQNKSRRSSSTAVPQQSHSSCTVHHCMLPLAHPPTHAAVRHRVAAEELPGLAHRWVAAHTLPSPATMVNTQDAVNMGAPHYIQVKVKVKVRGDSPQLSPVSSLFVPLIQDSKSVRCCVSGRGEHTAAGGGAAAAATLRQCTTSGGSSSGDQAAAAAAAAATAARLPRIRDAEPGRGGHDVAEIGLVGGAGLLLHGVRWGAAGAGCFMAAMPLTTHAPGASSRLAATPPPPPSAPQRHITSPQQPCGSPHMPPLARACVSGEALSYTPDTCSRESSVEEWWNQAGSGNQMQGEPATQLQPCRQCCPAPPPPRAPAPGPLLRLLLPSTSHRHYVSVKPREAQAKQHGEQAEERKPAARFGQAEGAWRDVVRSF